MYYGEVAKQYDSTRLSHELWNAESEVITNLLSSMPDGISVLDVPFGTGRFVPFYLRKNMVIHGLDASSAMLESAKDNLGEKYALCNLNLGNAEELPYRDDKFDLVICLRFLQGIITFGQVKRVVSEWHRVCKSWAILDVNVRKERAVRVRKPADHEGIRSSLNLKEIGSLMDDAGFCIKDVRPIVERTNYIISAVVCEKNRAA